MINLAVAATRFSAFETAMIALTFTVIAGVIGFFVANWIKSKDDTDKEILKEIQGLRVEIKKNSEGIAEVKGITKTIPCRIGIVPSNGGGCPEIRP